MAEQQESIFRKQSIDSVSSPEQLNDYIKSATPSVWFIMIGVVFLLVGICVWGVFGHLDTKITAGAECRNGTLTLYIPENHENTLKTGMTVTVNDREFTLSGISASPVQMTDAIDPYALHRSGLTVGDFGITATASADLPDGTYTAVITVDSVTPMSFVFN